MKSSCLGKVGQEEAGLLMFFGSEIQKRLRIWREKRSSPPHIRGRVLKASPDKPEDLLTHDGWQRREKKQRRSRKRKERTWKNKESATRSSHYASAVCAQPQEADEGGGEACEIITSDGKK